MMNVINVLDSTTYSKIAIIENVENPLITEEINGVFNFEFETVYDQVSKFASGGNIIEIDDDYFRIATTTKNLDGTYRVFAEHVSFTLSRAYFDDYVEEGIDGTASEILTPILNQIGWGVGSIDETPVKYYKPSAGTSVRKQILDIANLFGLEIIWHKFSVSLVTLRGSLGPIEFTLGENLLGVSETLDLTGEYPQFSYEVDVLDLSQLEGYEDFVKIEIGDVVQLLAPNIELDGISRVVYRQYNPFEKFNVNLQIGFVARDFTNYERDEKEGEEESDPTLDYWLETFTIDGVDMLIEPGIDDDIGALLEVDVIPKKIVVTIKEKYREYFIGVFTEQNGKGERTFTNSDFTNGTLTIDNGFTEAFKNGFVRVILSDKALNTPRADVQAFLVEVKLTGETNNYLLEYLEVDNTDYLNSFGLDMPEGATETIYDLVQRINIKLKDDPAINDVTVKVVYDGITNTYSKTNFVNNILSISVKMPEKSEQCKISIVVKKGNTTFNYLLNLELFKDEVDDDTSIGPSYYIESETVTVGSEGAIFTFTVPYDAVISVVPGVGKVEQVEPVTAHCSLIEDDSGMFTGVSVEVKGLRTGSVDVGIQAVCQEGTDEEGDLLG